MIWKIITVMVVALLAFFSVTYVYQNVPGDAVALERSSVVPEPVALIEYGAVPVFSENLRFNHNDISYYINPNCNSGKENKMKQAFSIITSRTEKLIKFYPTEEAMADILVGCSPDSYEKEENIFVAGEGGPTKIINSSFSVIMNGKVLLYNESKSTCDEPILELHELLHVFGYDHIGDKTKIMYPYLDCDQELNQDLINHMIEIYSIEPFADLYFESVSANKERTLGRWYLNFNVSINNQGIIDSEDSILKVSSEGELIESFDLKAISLGGGKNFYVNSLQIGSQTSDIEFVLETKTFDNNLKNNVRKLKAQ